MPEINVLVPNRDLSPPGAPQPQADELTRRLYEDASGSVVQVFGDGESIVGGTAGQITGSGFFVGNDGLVATNAHVALRRRELFVTTEGKAYRARLVAADDVKDVALLRLEGFQPQQARPVTVGDSRQLHMDDRIFALGHPNGVRATYISPGSYQERTSLLGVYIQENGQHSTLSAVEAIHHRTTPEEFVDFKTNLTQDVLAGRVNIRHGSSGGPLLDGGGRTVGMARTILNGDRSAAYFLPIEDVTSTMNSDKTTFRFNYEHQPSPLAKNYMYLWSNSPVAATVGTGVVGAAGYGGYRLLRHSPRAMGAALGAYGAASLTNDASTFLASTNERDAWKYGLSTLSDAAIVGGSVASFFPRTRAVGRWAMTLGVGGQIGSSFVPNRLVLSDVSRTDGSSRAPFIRDEVVKRLEKN